MIILGFMTDQNRVIGARGDAANQHRSELLPPALSAVMERIYAHDHVAVGRASLGLWRRASSSRVYVLTSNPNADFDEPHLEPIADIDQLVQRFYGSREKLLVAGGVHAFRRFLPYADALDVALVEQPIAGDVVFSDWESRFALESEEPFEGGRWGHYRRRSRRVNNAISLYLRGIRDGDAEEALSLYVGDHYVQHSTGVPDGKDGFIQFFGEFIKRYPERDIRIIRALEDPPYVFLHALQTLGDTQWITMDLFDTDANDRMVEHWDVISAPGEQTHTGTISVEGEVDIRDRESTDSNKAVVRELLERDVAYQEIVLLIGEGNFVATLCRVRRDGTDWAQTDLFRLDGGSVVERWHVCEPVPSPEVAKNSGKF